MRIKRIYIITVFYLLATVFSFKGISNSQIDPYPKIEIPVMDGGYNVKKFYNRPNSTKSLNYYIEADYPANKVLKFYFMERIVIDLWLISLWLIFI